MNFDYKAIGKRVKEERLNREWTQRELSDRSGISISHISFIERGLTEFSVGYLIDLSNAFNLTTDYLLTGVEGNWANDNNVLAHYLNDCTERELQVIVDCVISLKRSMRKQ